MQWKKCTGVLNLLLLLLLLLSQMIQWEAT